MDQSPYDSDILSWSERQAALLRRVAVGERINDQLDWPEIIEEIERAGRSDLHAVESWLTRAMLHDLKAEAWPPHRDVPHWRAETRLFRRQARRRFTESMRQRIDLPGLYRDALAGMPETVDQQPALAAPPMLTATLDELLAE